MNKEIVTEMVNDIINDKITQFIESISCDEFIEETTDKLIQGGIPLDVENEEEIEEVKEIIGSKVVEYLMKQILPKNKNVIEVDISFYHPEDENGKVDETKKIYDLDGMNDEFRYKLRQVIKNN
jgi:hypothetical protein